MTAADDRTSSVQLPLAATLLSASGLVTLWGFASVLYTRLPERFPAHFDGRGTPDRWVESTAANWFALPGIATAVVAGTIAAAWFCRWAALRRPRLVNLPFQERFLAASPNRRAWIVEPIIVSLALEGLVLASLFFFLIHANERVANGAWTKLPVVAFALFMPVSFATPIAGVAWTCLRAAKA